MDGNNQRDGEPAPELQAAAQNIVEVARRYQANPALVAEILHDTLGVAAQAVADPNVLADAANELMVRTQLETAAEHPLPKEEPNPEGWNTFSEGFKQLQLDFRV